MGWLSRFFSDPIDALTNNSVTETVTNTVKNIIEDPLPTLVNVGLMAFGVPPVLAGMAAGATSAAEHGGDILSGALTGGAMGYVGGAAAGAAGSAGLGNVASGAIGGAASGATGAVLTGGDIVQSALGGGLGGAASAALGNVITDNFGNPLDSLKQSLGLSSPNNPAAPIEERGTINGVPVSGPVSPYDLSSGTGTGDLGTGLKMNSSGQGLQAGGQNISTGSIGNSLYGVTGVLPTGTSGSPYDLVSSTGTGGQGLDINAKGQGLQASGGTGLQVGGNTGVQPISPLPEVTDAGNLYGLSSGQVSALNNSTTTPGGVPLIPLIPPVGKTKPASGVGSFKFGDVVPLQIPDAVNPGFIKPTAYYNTTDPAQAKYYWGAHDYQTGDTFNPNAYNIVQGAPTEAWGKQPAAFAGQGVNLVNPYAPVSTEGMQQTSPTPINTPPANLATPAAQTARLANTAAPLINQAPTTTTPVQPVSYLGENIPQYEPAFETPYTLPVMSQTQSAEAPLTAAVPPMAADVMPQSFNQPVQEVTNMSQPQAMSQPVSPDDAFSTDFNQFYNQYAQIYPEQNYYSDQQQYGVGNGMNYRDYINSEYNYYTAQNPDMLAQAQPA